MTLLERSELTRNEIFRNRVHISTLIAARTLLADEAQPFIVKKYAQHIVRHIGGVWIDTFVSQVVANPSINEASTDTDIQYTVNTCFEELSEAHYTNI